MGHPRLSPRVSARLARGLAGGPADRRAAASIHSPPSGQWEAPVAAVLHARQRLAQLTGQISAMTPPLIPATDPTTLVAGWGGWWRCRQREGVQSALVWRARPFDHEPGRRSRKPHGWRWRPRAWHQSARQKRGGGIAERGGWGNKLDTTGTPTWPRPAGESGRGRAPSIEHEERVGGGVSPIGAALSLPRSPPNRTVVGVGGTWRASRRLRSCTSAPRRE